MTRMNAAMREIPLELPGMEKLQPFVGAWAMHPQSSRKLLSAGRPSKVLGSLDEAIRKSGLESGMTVSFHHHFREGDCIVNLVMEAIARAGLRDMTLAASSLTSVHAPLKKLCERGVIRRIYTSGLRGALADAISRGMMDLPVVIQSHGGRARALLEGSLRPDVAFLGVPSCDGYGNARGWTGKSACGSLGYAMVDARVARTVVLLTDGLEDYPVAPASIGQVLVDWVVPVESVGDPEAHLRGCDPHDARPQGTPHRPARGRSHGRGRGDPEWVLLPDRFGRILPRRGAVPAADECWSGR